MANSKVSALAAVVPVSTDVAYVVSDPGGTPVSKKSTLANIVALATKTTVGLGSVDNLQQLPLSYLDTDGTLAANSDAKVPSQKAVKTYVAAQAPAAAIPLTYLDTDGTLAANSDAKVASQKAVKTYVGVTLPPSHNDFRLTLASGYPVYAPQPATPSSTDTSAETCTFAAAHGWVSGTIVTPSTTLGGLTVGTRYFLNIPSSTTCSFHTTVADALAGTNKVNLTASITGVIYPSGISNTTVYLSPYTGALLSLYSGSLWSALSSAEVSIALGTLTSLLPYDVFAYNNSGVLTLELLAWTSDTARATAIVRQDGVWCKTGALTRRLVGTIRTDTTTTTIDDAGGLAAQVGGKRFLSNVDNNIDASMVATDYNSATKWSYNTATIRQANGGAGNKAEMVSCLSRDAIRADILSSYISSAAINLECSVGIGLNSTTTFAGAYAAGTRLASTRAALFASFQGTLAAGYNYLAWNELGSGNAGSVTWAPSPQIYQAPSASLLEDASALTVKLRY